MRFLFCSILLVLSFVYIGNTNAQSDLNMTTHWYNRGGYNPAFIARTGYLYLFANVRQQWTGIEGAPKVVTVSGSEYVHKLRSAFGLSVSVDQIGVSRAINPMATYAFNMRFSNTWSLAMGISAGLFSRSINGTLFEADIPDDPSIYYTNQKSIKPDASAGMEFKHKYFILGLSSTHLFSANNTSDYLNSNHQYAYAIYKNNNSDEFYYKVGLQTIRRNNIYVVEGNLFVRLKHATGLMKGPREIFDFGLTLRSSRQLALILGINASANLRVGYAFEHSFITGYYPHKTHEIMLEYRIPNKPARTNYRCGGHHRVN